MAYVFISHRGNDAAEAQRLAGAIQAGGHQVWLDEWRIDLGDSIVEKLQEGLEAADFVIVCYSGEGVCSPWMGREWMSSLARQLNDFGVRLLPCRLTGGNPPAILADIKYADLVKDWDEGVSAILSALK